MAFRPIYIKVVKKPTWPIYTFNIYYVLSKRHHDILLYFIYFQDPLIKMIWKPLSSVECVAKTLFVFLNTRGIPCQIT
jgi:hypothetical protein